ncbi:MAG: hypothetical protein NWE98_09355, partial [Candidatus Bathyarchaeota archaeon]|nr:hypothetical protein [Candidatus Bathyarchaeota archaeon]
MNTKPTRKYAPFKSNKKIQKLLAICIGVLLIVSMTLILAENTVQAATSSSPLHTVGRSVVDANGNTVYLRGVGLAGIAPNLILWGSGSGDSWAVQWNYNPTAVMEQTFNALQNQWHVNMIRVFIY